MIPRRNWRGFPRSNGRSDSHKLSLQGASGRDLSLLRRRVEEMEEVQDQARVAVEKLSEAVDKLRAPALRLAPAATPAQTARARLRQPAPITFAASIPNCPRPRWKRARAFCSTKPFAVTDSFGFDKNGPVVKIV